jgi:hypothetical protein
MKNMNGAILVSEDGTREYSALERYMLLRSHPRKIFFDLIALVWTIYFLWQQSLAGAFFVGLGISLVGTMSVTGANPDRLSQTTLGKLLLLHLHPVNLTTQIVGVIPLLYGVWDHSALWILTGFSLVAFGHIYGWEKVDPRLEIASV